MDRSIDKDLFFLHFLKIRLCPFFFFKPFNCNIKQIKISISAANRRFTAVAAENGGFRYLPFFGDGQKK